ncbi:MAG: zf-HC2 domain-containing protein [Actinomycetota bacterium]|nr:zf-HC2 domain-containing protein [Actinomycetota bacterium]
MMRCKRYQGDLSAFLDGELSEVKKGKIQAHLATCEACQEKLDELDAVKFVLGAVEKKEIPLGLAERLAALPKRDNEGHQTRERSKHTRAIGLALSTVALATILALSVLIYRQGGLFQGDSVLLEDLVKQKGGSEAMLSKAPQETGPSFEFADTEERLEFDEDRLGGIIEEISLELEAGGLISDLPPEIDISLTSINTLGADGFLIKPVLFNGRDALLVAAVKGDERALSALYVFDEETKELLFEKRI